MSLRMPSGLPARIIQVLNDYLPAELDLIDAEEGEFATPDIGAADYHEWDRPLITRFPAVTMAVTRARVLEVQPVNFGSRVHAIYEVDLKAHTALATASEDALKLQKLAFRYATGILRVLCVQKVGLETAADPTEYGSPGARVIVRARELRWGPTEGQETGQQTRTATVGIDVDKTEAR